MTIYEAMNAPLRQILLSVLMLLLVLQMTVLLAVFREKRKQKIRWLHILHFLISFAVMYFLMYVICREIYHSGGAESRPSLLAAGCSFPVVLIIIYEILTAGVLAAAFRDLFYYRRSHLTGDAIKETMDLMPAGIAFGKPDGTVVFRNLAMDDLARRATGRPMHDIGAFRETGSEESNVSPGRSMQVALPDGSGVWQAAIEDLIIDGVPYIQLTASDITGQAAIIHELEEKNRKLREMQMRLDIYNRQAEQIIIAQELLSARMAVHNEVGNVLLESRHYLNDPASIDEELLLQALKNTNTYLLKDSEEDDTAGDPLPDALEMADAIGVEVYITGIIPEEERERGILASAIVECATNTVKHAGGDRLLVDIRNGRPKEARAPEAAQTMEADNSKEQAPEAVQIMEAKRIEEQAAEAAWQFVFRNNGEQPAEAVRESGGLASLRSLVEKEKGIMKIDSVPAFRLMISLPPEKTDSRH